MVQLMISGPGICFEVFPFEAYRDLLKRKDLNRIDFVDAETGKIIAWENVNQRVSK